MTAFKYDLLLPFFVNKEYTHILFINSNKQLFRQYKNCKIDKIVTHFNKVTLYIIVDSKTKIVTIPLNREVGEYFYIQDNNSVLVITIKCYE